MAVRKFVGMMLASMAGVALVGGCTPSTDGDPKPTTTTKVAQADLWDPCTIPADALTRTGLDPATASRDIAGVKQEGWKICGWKATWYYISVFSTNYTLDDVKRNPRNTEFTNVFVGPRAAVLYREKSDTKRSDCDVAFGIAQGAVLVNMQTFGSVDTPRDDPCAVVMRYAVDLEPNMPSK